MIIISSYLFYYTLKEMNAGGLEVSPETIKTSLIPDNESLIIKSPEGKRKNTNIRNSLSSLKIEIKPLEEKKKNVEFLSERLVTNQFKQEEIIGNILEKKSRTDEEAWTLYDHIKDFKFFHQVLHDQTEPESILKIVKSLRYRKIKAGRPVFVENEPSNGNMYVVYSGELFVMVKKLDVIAEANLFSTKKFNEKKFNYGETMMQDLKHLKTMMTEVSPLSPLEDEVPKDIAIKTEENEKFNQKKRKNRSQRCSKVKFSRQNTLEHSEEPKSSAFKQEVDFLKSGGQPEKLFPVISIDSNRSHSKRMKSQSDREEKRANKEDTDSNSYGYVKDKIYKGEYFVERALESNANRGATILANTDCELLVLTTQTYNTLKTQLNKKIKEMMDFLIQTIPGLREINAREIMKSYIYLFEEKIYHYGNHIANEGEKGEIFYFLYEGACEVYRTVKVDEDESLPSSYFKIKSSFFNQSYAIKEKIPLTKLKEGGLIGEELLFSEDSCYNYSVQVSSDSCKIICVKKDIFNFRFPKEIVEKIRKSYEEKREYKEDLLCQNLEKRNLKPLEENLNVHFLRVKRNTHADINKRIAKINNNPSQFTSYKVMIDNSLNEDFKSKDSSPQLPKIGKIGNSFLLDAKESQLKQKLLPYTRTNIIKMSNDKGSPSKHEEAKEVRLPYLSKSKNFSTFSDAYGSSETPSKIDHIRKTESCSPFHDINAIYENLSLKLNLDINPNTPQATKSDIDHMKLDFGRDHGLQDKWLKIAKIQVARKYPAFSYSENSSTAASPKNSSENKPHYYHSDSLISNKFTSFSKAYNLDRIIVGKMEASPISSLKQNSHNEKSNFSRYISNQSPTNLSPVNFRPTDSSPASSLTKFEPTFLKDFNSSNLKNHQENEQNSLGELILKKGKHAYQKSKIKKMPKHMLHEKDISKQDSIQTKTSKEESIEPSNTIVNLALSLQVSSIKTELPTFKRKRRTNVQKNKQQNLS